MKEAIDEIISLFDEAKQRSEFDFVLTLINYKQIGARELASNLHEWFEAIEFYKSLYNSLHNKEKTRIATLLYSTFFENSDFYNIIGSLCRIKLGFKGSSYLFWKTKKYERLLGVGEKQDYLLELLEDADKQNLISFFLDNHHKQIRNTFFHSAYSLSEDEFILHDSDQIRGIGLSFNVIDFLYPKVDNVIQIFDIFKKLYLDSFIAYQVDKKIDANFPYPTTATILGSEHGLKGYKIERAVQFFGQWYDAGIWFDDRFGMWAGHNINIYFDNIETIEIRDSLIRYEGKDDINKSDYEFQNLVDKIIERNIPQEIARATNLLLKFGDARFQKMLAEQNGYKQKSFPRIILPFYRQAVEIGSQIVNLDLVKRNIKKLEDFMDAK